MSIIDWFHKAASTLQIQTLRVGVNCKMPEIDRRVGSADAQLFMRSTLLYPYPRWTSRISSPLSAIVREYVFFRFFSKSEKRDFLRFLK